MRTINSAPSEELAFIKSHLAKVAWRRLFATSAAIGFFGTVAASNKINTVPKAIGYAIGYGGTFAVMVSGSVIVFGKTRKN